MKEYIQPMPPPYLDINLSKGSIIGQLIALGATYVCNSARYYWDGSLFQQLAINTAHDSVNPRTGVSGGYLPEPAETVTTKWSADFSNVLWLKSAGITRTNATSCISGQVASKLTAAASSDNISQIGAVSTSSTQMSQCIIEKGTSKESRVEVYNGTSLTPVGNAIIDWSTLAVTSTLGTNYSLRWIGTGANGGELYQLNAFATGVTSGNIRSFRLFPDSSGGGGYCYLHHAYCVIGTSPVFSPVVTGASNVTRGATTVSLPLSAIKGFFNLKGATMLVDVEIPYHNGVSRIAIQMTGSTTSERISLTLGTTGIFAGLMVNTSSFSPADQMALLTNTPMVIGGSFGAGNACIAKQGRLNSNRQGSLAMPNLLTLEVGNLSTGASQFSGYITRIRLYNAIGNQLLPKATLK